MQRPCLHLGHETPEIDVTLPGSSDGAEGRNLVPKSAQQARHLPNHLIAQLQRI